MAQDAGPRPPEMAADDQVRILRRSITRNRARLAAGTGLISLHQLAEATVPILIGVGIDRAVAPGDGTALLLWVAALGALFVGLHLCYRFGARQLMLAIANEAYLLRGELAAKIVHPRRLRTDLRAGELLTVSSTDADNVSYLLDYVPRIAGALTATAVSATVLLVVDVQLGLVVLIGTPVVLVGMQFAGPLITRRVTEQQELAGKATALATDLVSGVRPLRGARRRAGRRPPVPRRQPGLAARRAAGRRHHRAGTSRSPPPAARCSPAASPCSPAGSPSTAASASASSSWSSAWPSSCSNRSGCSRSCRAGSPRPGASADRAALVLGADLLLPPGTPQKPAQSRIWYWRALRHGTLDGLDLTVRPGEFVGVVTPRSADGEAIVRLLAGGVPPGEYEGWILLGGVALHDLEPAHARAVLLVEPHHTDLFTGTVAANVTGRPPDGRSRTRRRCARPWRRRPPTRSSPPIPTASTGTSRSAAPPCPAGNGNGSRSPGRCSPSRRSSCCTTRRPPSTPSPSSRSRGPSARCGTATPAGRAARPSSSPAAPRILAVTDRVVVVDDGRVAVEGGHAELGATHDDYRKVVLR